MGKMVDKEYKIHTISGKGYKLFVVIYHPLQNSWHFLSLLFCIISHRSKALRIQNRAAEMSSKCALSFEEEVFSTMKHFQQ